MIKDFILFSFKKSIASLDVDPQSTIIINLGFFKISFLNNFLVAP